MKGNMCLLSLLSAYCMPRPLLRASGTRTQLSLFIKNRNSREAEVLARVSETRWWSPNTQAFSNGAVLGLCFRETSLASAHTTGRTPSTVRENADSNCWHNRAGLSSGLARSNFSQRDWVSHQGVARAFSPLVSLH